MQKRISTLEQYSKEWGLELNLSKTKIMIFNKQGATKEIQILLSRTRNQNSETVYISRICIHTIWKKHQEVENLINKVKKWLYKSGGKTVNTTLNLIDTTIKPVVFGVCKSWGDHKDQNNLSNIEKFHLPFCKQILGVKNNTSSSKLLRELGRFPFRITTETQLFKYLQRIPFAKEDCYLRKAFNKELANKESGWVTKMRHLLGSYSMSNLILNIFKVLNGEIDKKEYKNKHKFSQKRV